MREGESNARPAGAFEGVGDLADRDGSAVWVVDGDLSGVSDAIAADVLQIDVRHCSLRLLHVRHLLRHEVLRLIHQARHRNVTNTYTDRFLRERVCVNGD